MIKDHSFWVIIPARIESSRLPGKILIDICGKPMIAHVIEKAKKSGAERVIVATDSNQIRKTSQFYGAESIMTSSTHTSGSDRIAEALMKINAPDDQIIINLQGDEPLMNPNTISNLANSKVKNKNEAVGTVVSPLKDLDEVYNPNCVKVVMNERNNALYFSRAAIPYNSEIDFKKKEIKTNELNFYRHIGIYAFSVKSLKKFIKFGPCELEKIEKLEQLRWLWMEEKIKLVIDDSCAGIGVDTLEDLEYVRKILE